ncbi:ribonuclease P protein subunit p40 isoform X1 [Parasteatoda tepidariorum]|uniref:ribonuclease P protein subunit p40 isoform X1 n=1 Tax=Parasteatoda tepidariorum TaxID=114398 RepID=UPI001C71E31E|nr:uncharacterized protein LOC107457321 isoform X1 [Parasteatoda tepidariorum]
MLNFPPPEHIMKFHEFDEEYLLKKCKLFDRIPFHSVHLLLSSSETLVDDFKTILLSDESNYFFAQKVPASSLIHESFIENFVRTGLLCALSQSNNGDVGNLVTITASGKLVVQLENNVAGYLSLLREKSSNHHFKEAKSHQIYFINISSNDFSPGKKLHETVSSELQKIDHIKFDLLLKWIPRGDVCCESLREYFESKGYECHPCQPQYKPEIKFDVPIPQLNFESMDQTLVESALEWVGAQVCGVEYADESDAYASKFHVPELSEKGKLHIYSFQGFYTSSEINKALQIAKSCFSKIPNLPFITLMLSGYQQCYVDSQEFGKFISADKLICIFISPQFKYHMVTLNL